MLSKYNLSCGYVQQSEQRSARVELYREHNCYHIRAFNFELVECRLVWESTESLTYARQQYSALKRLLGIRN